MRQRNDFEVGKQRSMNDEKERNPIGPDDTVYRYLCLLNKIGSIIGIGGDIAKQLRAQTHAKIRIGETIPGCDERVVTIYSTSDETNRFGNEPVSPAQDALFRVHDKVVDEGVPLDDDFDEPQMATVRLLVPSDQIGCVIGKGGHVVQNIRNESQAQIRILGSDHLPPCALSSDELIQISGEASTVKKALYQIAFRLHDNPSRSQHLLLSSPSIYRSGIAFGTPSIKGTYGNYKNEGSITKEFTVRLVCPTEFLGAVIGKGGSAIRQIRQESGAFIVIDSAGADEDDCIISVSSKEMFESPSRTIDAIIRLQPRCSDKIERDSGDSTITTRLLVPSSSVGCIIGKGGAVIKEMRNTTRANIRIFADENIPRVASDDDEMVQITGDMTAAKNALILVMQRLRVNVFETDTNSSPFPMTAPYHPPSTGQFDAQKSANRNNRMNYPGFSAYAGGPDSKPVPLANSFASYGASQFVSTSGYGAYAAYPAGHPSGVSLSNQYTVPPGRSYGY